MKHFSKIIAICCTLVCTSAPAVGQTDFDVVEQTMQHKGAVQGNILKLTFPRSDLHVRVGDVAIESGLALTSWLAFEKMGAARDAMLMGDLVLLESEIPQVEDEMAKQGLDISAIHNHLLGESPVIRYMHISGRGSLADLAEKMHAVLAHTATPLAMPAPPAATQLDWSVAESTLGLTGTRKGNLLLFGVPRKDPITEHGIEIPPYMGVATAINMQAVGDKVATTGDFVLAASEVNPVLRQLRAHGITATAIHCHMLEETPRLFFMHFWGLDSQANIAAGLKAALDKTNSKMK